MKKGLRDRKASTAMKSEALHKQFMLRAVQLIAETVISAKAKKNKESFLMVSGQNCCRRRKRHFLDSDGTF
jgi:hypothetical protein